MKVKQNQNRIDTYNLAPKKCVYCKKKIHYTKRSNVFCSRSCAAFYNNAQKDRKEHLCSYCSGIIKPFKKGQIHCSIKCRKLSEWEERKNRIEKIGRIDIDGWGSPIISKRYLTEIYGHKCSICGGTEWRGEPIPLVLDHANGNPTDWSIPNLRLVCGNCNMQLPTFTGRNHGNGRASRREFYKKHGYC
jgi:hypothetical protein